MRTLRAKQGRGSSVTFGKISMLASLEKATTTIVVLGERDIRNIVDRLTAFSPDVSVHFRGADDINRQPQDLDALFRYPNPQGKEIVSLGFSVRSRGANARASLKLLVRERENVLFDATGDEADIRQLSEDIDELLDGTRPWYSGIARLRYGKIGGGLFGVMLVCLFVIAVVLPDAPKAQHEQKVTIEYLLPRVKTLALWSFGLFSPIILGGLADKLKAKLFPSTVLLLGHGAQRHTNREWIRTSVVVGFAISFIAGLLLWALT